VNEWQKLAEISPLLRTAFWLREIEGLSAEEAAQALEFRATR